MSAVPTLSIANLVDDAGKDIDAYANESRQGVKEEGDWHWDDEGKGSLQEVVDTSVSPVVAAKVTLVMKNDSAAFIGFVSCELVDEHVGTQVSSAITAHDSFFEAHRVQVEPADCKGKRDDCKDEPLNVELFAKSDPFVVLFFLPKWVDSEGDTIAKRSANQKENNCCDALFCA